MSWAHKEVGMKFLHCADVHLGCPGGEERMRAFSNMLAFCKQEGIGILLIAGDLFDAPRVDERTAREAFALMQRYPSLCVMIAAGNHDPLCEGGNYDRKLPANVYVFGREWSCAEIPAYNVRVWGASFTSQSEPPFVPDQKKRRLTPGLYDLGVLHGDLTSRNAQSDYRAISISGIGACKVQYLALGHIHARSPVKRAGGTLYAYSGCLQGMGFDEVGEMGAYMGEITQDGLSMAFVKLCGSMTLEKTLNISGCADTTEIAALYDHKIGEIPGHRVALTLTGTLNGYHADVPALKRLLASRSAGLRIEDETRVEIDHSGVASENTLRGAFAKRMLEKIEQTEKNGEDASVAREALKMGLTAFEGEVAHDVD